MLLLIVFVSLLGVFSGILFCRFLEVGVCYITTTCIFLSFLLSLYLFNDVVLSGNVYKLIMGSWSPFESLDISWCFYFDTLTCLMLIVVTFISSLVHLYSTEYMEFDPYLQRFMFYLSLFIFSMFILITS